MRTNLEPVTVAVACIAMALAWLVPNHYPPWLAAYAEILAATAVLALGVGTSLGWGVSLAVPWPALFFVALAVVPAVQGAFGLIAFLGDAWVVVMYLLCAAAAIIWSARASRLDSLRWTDSFAATLLAGALLSSVVLGLQRWEIDAGPASLFIAAVAPGHAPFANLGQPNQVATLLALGLAALMYFHERGTVRAAYATVAAVLLTFALVVTQARTAILFWIVVIVWHGRFASRFRLRTPRLSIVGLSLGWLALFPLWPSIVSAMGFANLASAASRLLPGPRTIIWPQMLEAIVRHPWLGYGWNQTTFAQMAVRASRPGRGFTESAHNLVLDLAVWNGVPIAALVVSLAVWWLVRAQARLRSLPGAFALLVVLLFLTHAMVEFPLMYLYFLVPFALAIGTMSNDLAPDSGWVLPFAARTALPLVFAAVGAFAAIDYVRVEDAYREMRFAVARFGTPMPDKPPPLLRTEFTQLAAFHRFSLTTPRGPLDKDELEWVRNVAYRFPYSASMYHYALAQALSGDLTGAQSTLALLRGMYGDGAYGEARAELMRMGEGQPILRQLVLPAPPPVSR